jgi:hypothetical protein
VAVEAGGRGEEYGIGGKGEIEGGEGDDAGDGDNSGEEEGGGRLAASSSNSKQQQKPPPASSSTSSSSSKLPIDEVNSHKVDMLLAEKFGPSLLSQPQPPVSKKKAATGAKGSVGGSGRGGSNPRDQYGLGARKLEEPGSPEAEKHHAQSLESQVAALRKELKARDERLQVRKEDALCFSTLSCLQLFIKVMAILLVRVGASFLPWTHSPHSTPALLLAVCIFN